MIELHAQLRVWKNVHPITDLEAESKYELLALYFLCNVRFSQLTYTICIQHTGQKTGKGWGVQGCT